MEVCLFHCGMGVATESIFYLMPVTDPLGLRVARFGMFAVWDTAVSIFCLMPATGPWGYELLGLGRLLFADTCASTFFF